MKKIPLIFLSIVLSTLCLQSFAAKPVRNDSTGTNEPAATTAAPEVFAVKIDYPNGFIVVEGANLDPSTATATIAGVPLTVDAASTDSMLRFPFTSEVTAAVSELGNYVLNISTAGGSFTLTAFIPFALSLPDGPLPPGAECPCSTEWDLKGGASPPDGFDGLVPYCNQDTGSFVTVQFYDTAYGNYWVLWTEWTGSSGYCALYLDAPERELTSQDQFDACAAYLRGIVTVWGSQGNMCLF